MTPWRLFDRVSHPVLGDGWVARIVVGVPTVFLVGDVDGARHLVDHRDLTRLDPVDATEAEMRIVEAEMARLREQVAALQRAIVTRPREREGPMCENPWDD